MKPPPNNISAFLPIFALVGLNSSHQLTSTSMRLSSRGTRCSRTGNWVKESALASRIDRVSPDLSGTHAQSMISARRQHRSGAARQETACCDSVHSSFLIRDSSPKTALVICGELGVSNRQPREIGNNDGRFARAIVPRPDRFTWFVRVASAGEVRPSFH